MHAFRSAYVLEWCKFTLHQVQESMHPRVVHPRGHDQRRLPHMCAYMHSCGWVSGGWETTGDGNGGAMHGRCALSVSECMLYGDQRVKGFAFVELMNVLGLAT